MQLSKKSILIIEDHDSMRNGLSFIVNSSEKYTLVGASQTGEQGVVLARKFKPDIVLMDIGLPGINGIECTQTIKSEFPDTRILICTVSEDEDKIFKALAAGADGYILKKSSPSQIIDAIDDLVNGGAPISSPVARKMVDFFKNKSVKLPETETLTDRELEILDQISLGYRNKEISEKLHISVTTVKTHVYNIYQKLHVQSRVEAVNAFNRMKGLGR